MCESVAIAVRKVLSSSTSSRSFSVASVVPTQAQEQKAQEQKAREQRARELGYDFQNPSSKKRRAITPLEKSAEAAPKRVLTLSSFANAFTAAAPATKASKPLQYAKDLVRTNAGIAQGALEPYLRKTQQLSQDSQQSEKSAQSKGSIMSAASTSVSSSGPSAAVVHDPSCDLFNLDLSVPGAFAKSCTCGADLVLIAPSKSRRPQKVVATKCAYTSVAQLRLDVQNRADGTLNEKLKTSTYVGSVSRQRSLIQVGVELLMISHYELAKELFYQLALARFGGGAGKGRLPDQGVDVKACIIQALSMTDGVSSTPPCTSEEELEEQGGSEQRHFAFQEPFVFVANF